MPTVSDVLQAIESFAPPRWAFSFDKVGLQVGRMSAAVESAVVSLDWSDELLAFALSKSAALIICHHPLIWDPLTELTEKARASEMALKLAESGLAMIASHTNWDSAPGGISDTLAAVVELNGVEPFGSAAEVPMSKIVTFAPVENVEAIIDALSGAEAGQIGNYSRCAFKGIGEGTFFGGPGSVPYNGEADRVESVDEIRIEMIIRSENVSRAVSALLVSHPYETPAYDIFPLASAKEMPVGRIGTLEKKVAFSDFVRTCEEKLSTKCLAWGEPNRTVSRVAVVGGAADSEWHNALEAGSDVILTGEVKHDRALGAVSSGICVVAAGHYATEQPGMSSFRDKIAGLMPEIAWHLFTPEPGFAGRPF